MSLGEILRQFDDERVVAQLLPELGDAQWQERATSAASAQGETPGEYAGAAVARFAADAQDEDWLSLLSALNRAADPGAICLRRIIDWAMRHDGADEHRCQKHKDGESGSVQ